MNANRKPFTLSTKKQVLIDLHGQPMKCSYPGCKCQAKHIHHEEYVCKGGTNEVENLTPYCAKHHTELHQDRGDFKVWGGLGGQKTAASLNVNALSNLPQFKGEAGKERLAAYIQRKMSEMGMA